MIDKTSNHIRLDEKNHVEEPFLETLDSLGWKVIRLDTSQTPKDSFRDNFSEVVLLPKLKEGLISINSWLEDNQIDEVIWKGSVHRAP